MSMRNSEPSAHGTHTAPSTTAPSCGTRPLPRWTVLVIVAVSVSMRVTSPPRDGRSTLIRLTPSGVRATEACFPAFGAAINSVRSRLGERETEIRAAMEELSRCLTEAIPEGPAEFDVAAQG